MQVGCCCFREHKAEDFQIKLFTHGPGERDTGASVIYLDFRKHYDASLAAGEDLAEFIGDEEPGLIAHTSLPARAAAGAGPQTSNLRPSLAGDRTCTAGKWRCRAAAKCSTVYQASASGRHSAGRIFPRSTYSTSAHRRDTARTPRATCSKSRRYLPKTMWWQSAKQRTRSDFHRSVAAGSQLPSTPWLGVGWAKSATTG